MEQEASDLILFFGRFHPMILHLPIGFLLMAAILEGASRLCSDNRYQPAIGLVLSLGALSALVTAALGYMLANAGGYNEEMLAIHQWSGSAVALTACAAWLFWRQKEKKPSRWADRAYLGSLAAVLLTLTVAGHYGGSLTHGSDYLTRYMPDPLRAVFGLPPREDGGIPLIEDLPEAEVYRQIIHPILETRCVSCHGDNKYEGDLRMDGQEFLEQGGESGPLFVAGSSGESELVRRVLLPEGDEDRMPPDGRRPLTDHQTALLEWWIDSGAPFDRTVADLDVSDEMQEILNTLVDPMAGMSEADRYLAAGVEPADESAISLLRNQGVSVLPISVESHWLQARVPDGVSGDSLMVPLGEIREQLTWLALGGTTTSDEAMEQIGGFQNLTRLHLQNTEISDAGLPHLRGLNYLEYLNLYGTSVTDQGLEHLRELSGLKRLYLWQTGVTEEGVELFREARPGVTVFMGIEADSSFVRPVADVEGGTESGY
ncbi:MAG: c-type cytochrome domain-containing protein [Balneolaceae bacterium]